MHLFLFVIWTGLGIWLILHSAMTGGQSLQLPLPGNPSAGWLALVLAAYNFIQWWARESMRRERQRQELAEAERRERLLEQRRSETPGAVDPNFRFTDDRPPD